MEAIQTNGMHERYEFHEIEAHWQRVWEERGTFRAPDADPRPKLYVLQMFPYPSGDLHAGHIRNYVLGDAIARYFRMRGYNVMHPMGFDSFGLPAEQAAIDREIQPREWIATCVENSRRQFMRYGFSFDWSREVVTSEPEYYRWTQWLFARFHELGLVYRKELEVNWCEEHGVLANDEVKEGGCWRCDRPVRKKKLAQWLMRTTDYADELLAGLERLPGWNDAVRTMQRNWIGRSEGTNIDFAVPALVGAAFSRPEIGGNMPPLPSDEAVTNRTEVGAAFSRREIGGNMPPLPSDEAVTNRTEVGAAFSRPEIGGNMPPLPVIRVFTTRVDTIFGCTFMAIAPDHPLAAAMAQAGGTAEALAHFKDECAREAVEYGVAEEKPKKGLRAGGGLRQPVQRRGPAGVRHELCRQRFRHRRGDGRPGARHARPRLRAGIRATGQAGDRARSPEHGRHWQCRCISPGVLSRQRRLRQLRRVRRAGLPRGQGGDGRLAGAPRPGRGDGAVPPARLEHEPPALLGRAAAAGALRQAGGAGRLRLAARARRTSCPCACPRSRTTATSRSARWPTTAPGSAPPAPSAAGRPRARPTP